MKNCADCGERLSKMVAARRAVESQGSELEQPPFELLAAQRRRVYVAIERPSFAWYDFPVRKWAAAGAMVLLLGGGAALYEQGRHADVDNRSKVSDAQLAQEVSQVAGNSEPSSTAPLEGLFDE